MEPAKRLRQPALVPVLDIPGPSVAREPGLLYKLNRSVDSIIASDLPRDVLLVGTSLVLSVIVAVPVGVMQAVKRNRGWDYAGTATAFVLYSMPSYALGLILIGLFAITIKALPPEAPQGTTVLVHARPSLRARAAGPDPDADQRGPVLPLHALVSHRKPGPGLHQDGSGQGPVPNGRSCWRHLLRNSLVPVATLVGLSLPAVLTAGLVIEYLFNFQGMGLEYFNAATTDDFPVMLGITVLIGSPPCSATCWPTSHMPCLTQGSVTDMAATDGTSP